MLKFIDRIGDITIGVAIGLSIAEEWYTASVFFVISIFINLPVALIYRKQG